MRGIIAFIIRLKSVLRFGLKKTCSTRRNLADAMMMRILIALDMAVCTPVGWNELIGYVSVV